MTHHRFGTAINCIDGRVQEVVAEWLKERYQLDYIDMITEPGADGLLASSDAEAIEQVKSRAKFSVSAHGANVLAIVGHHDCKANQVPKETHLEQIKQALQVAWHWNLPATIVGLWVNESWLVEVVE